MRPLYALVCLLWLFSILMTGESRLAKRNMPDSVSQHMYRVHGNYTEERHLENAIHRAHTDRLEKKAAELFYHRYHKGQPVIAAADRKGSPQAILHTMCKASPCEGAEGGCSSNPEESQEEAEENMESPALDDASDFSALENSGRLYRAIGKILSCYPEIDGGEPSPDGVGPPTFNGINQDAPPAESEADPDVVLNFVYAQMIDAAAAGSSTTKGAKPLASYFLESERFASFLDSWKPNRRNAGFHISRGDVSLLRADVKENKPYRLVSKDSRLLLARLFFVRTGLDAFDMMEAAKYELGIEFDGRMTVDAFLHTLYEYYLAVLDSDGGLRVVAPVAHLFMATPLFSCAYAQCELGRMYVPPKHRGARRSTELGLYLLDEAPKYIKSLVALALAWEASSYTKIDQDEMFRVMREMNAYYRSA
ncbi:hypothetical protein PAPHI01_2404 [Pancytospora philotis]|nr:hypothetical protein PAPHI01_2404 [Pancytospora philotis]